MFRKLLLGGAALCTLAAGNSAIAATVATSNSALRLSLVDTTDASGNSIDPFYGKINPFYGKINPFYGKINPFYGKISPFWGKIQPFWGDINPFYGKINPFSGLDQFWGKIQPFAMNPNWASIGPYWENAGPEWGDINANWQALQDSGSGDYSSVQTQFNGFMSEAASFWNASVKKYTGKDFYSFANAMLADYGIDPSDPNSLANADAATRSQFFLNFYDGLMSFTGVDHVDWWMPAVNWSPALAQTEGANKVVVGVLDATVSGANADVANLKFVGGYNFYVNDHGAAVASLIAAAHDGTSVMGVDPNAQINLYNPFDTTGTASWNDVATGIAALYASGAHVVNASLGVPGTVLSNEWINILSGSLLSGRSNDLVIVKAAGNEGVTQTANVPWLLNLSPPNNIILVGSVDPNNNISSFSNQPGEACLTVAGICLEANKLKYRFIVAPGELMLVSDNNGGVTRMTGTSFAAPLVTGAVALLQARWPWLQQHAPETTQIIFQSADDLGAPGVDPVYGWGMLDIQASQSPLNFDNLTVYAPTAYNNGKAPSTGLLGTGLLSSVAALSNYSAKQLKAAVVKPGQLQLWQNQNAYVVAFENIGTTYRDFEIPLSSTLAGKNQTVNGASNPFQAYLYQRMIDWANGKSSLAFNTQRLAVDSGEWSFGFASTQSTQEEVDAGQLPYHPEFVATNRETGLSVKAGQGNGANAFLGGGAFSLRSDFDTATGGVDPVLGFASGGAYAKSSIEIADGLEFGLGVSQKTDSHIYVDPTFGPQKVLPLDTYNANAAVATMDYAIGKKTKLSASFTQLNEANGLLGGQGAGALSFGANRTEAATFGASTAFGAGWTLSGSATAARTLQSAAGDSMLTMDTGGLLSSAWEFAANKQGVFGDADWLRISATQPLHVESGALQYQEIEVVDRDTGELGATSQTWGVSGLREYRLEAIYSTPVMNGLGELQGFGLVDFNAPTQTGQSLSLAAGGQFKVAF